MSEANETVPGMAETEKLMSGGEANESMIGGATGNRAQPDTVPTGR